MDKFVFFAFKGDPMCFVHVLLNALDMYDKGATVKIVFEGEAVTLIQTLTEQQNPLYKKALEAGLVDGVCKACSAKMGVLAYNEASGIRLLDNMSGHPSMFAYVQQGYELIVL